MPAPLSYPLFHVETPAGVPGAGWLLYSFAANSSTPQDTYTDSTLAVANENPVVLDAVGEKPVWLDDVLYKFVLHDANDVPVWSIDSVSGAGGGSGSVGPQGPPGPAGPQGPPGSSASSAGQWVTFGANPSYVSATSFRVAGDYTSTFPIGTRVKSTNTAGTSYGQVTAASFAGGNTTVTLYNTAGVLDSGLSTVATGIITAANNALPIFTRVGIVFGTLLANPGIVPTPLTIASAVADTLGEVTAGASGVFTARHAGVYGFGGHTRLSAASGTTLTIDHHDVDIYKNNVVIAGSFGRTSWPYAAGTIATMSIPCNTVLSLAAGDVISFKLLAIFSGTAPTVGGGAINVLRLS